MKSYRCVICGLQTGRNNGERRFFMAKFPQNVDRCREWVRLSGQEDLAYIPIEKLNKNKYLCGKHFKEDDFNEKGTKLNKLAVPSMLLRDPPLSDEIMSEFPCHVHPCYLGKTKKKKKKDEEKHTDEVSDNSMDIPDATENAEYQEDIDTESIQWLRQKLNCVWYSAKFCGMCLESENLNTMNVEMLINKQQESKSLMDIINYLFKENAEDIMSSPFICDKCTEKTLQSFMFVNNTKKLSKIINSCILEMESEFVDINENILNLLSRDHSNLMVILAKDKSILADIKEMNAVSEIVPTPKPVLKLPLVPPPTISDKLKDHDYFANTTAHISAKAGEIVIKPIKMKGKATIPEYMIYKCTKCVDIFTTHKSLKEHEKLKHCPKVYSCKVCSKIYMTLQSLDLHYKTHDAARCRYCMDIVNESDLMEHLKVQHGPSLFSCTICDSIYYTHEALQIHVKVSHNTAPENTELCQYCCKMLSDTAHKCKFNCPECTIAPCIHHKYLISYRDQILSHASKARCLDCDYTTSRKEYLVTHANREHLDHHPFTCGDCNKQFYTKTSLKIHVDQFHVDNTCGYCDREFKSTAFLLRHKHQCKNIKRAIKCDKCVASFENNEDYEKHAFLKHNNGGFQCDLCKKRFTEEIALQQHKVMIHNTVQYKKRRRNIECTLCNVKFDTLNLLQQHQDEVHKVGTLFPCKNCPKKFSRLKQLQGHQQKHYERKQCDKCKRRIIAAFFVKHSIRCNATKIENHICELCGKVVVSEAALKIHNKTHQKVICVVCNRPVRETLLEKHLHRHEKELSSDYKNIMHACEVCGHLVRRKHDLETHMNRFHLKIKPFKCDKCGKSFCGRTRLKEHLSTHKVTTCICHICNKKLANRVCLKMHLRIHTGECPYTCKHCGESFRTSSILNTHVQKKHLEKTVSCPSCDSMFHFVREMRYHFKHVHWKQKDRPFNYKEAVPEMYYHLFEDRRMPKIDSTETIIEMI